MHRKGTQDKSKYFLTKFSYFSAISKTNKEIKIKRTENKEEEIFSLEIVITLKGAKFCKFNIHFVRWSNYKETKLINELQFYF